MTQDVFKYLLKTKEIYRHTDIFIKSKNDIRVLHKLYLHTASVGVQSGVRQGLYLISANQKIRPWDRG